MAFKMAAKYNSVKGAKVALIGFSKYSLLANFLRKNRNYTSCYTYPVCLFD